MSALCRRELLRLGVALAVFPGVLLASRESLDAESLDASESALLDAVNAVRAAFGAGALVPESRLTAAVAGYAPVLQGKPLNHFLNDTTPWGRVAARDYRWAAVGEVLASGFCDADAVVRAWLASPTHKAVLLDPVYRECGLAVRRFDNVTYWLLDLACPAATS